MVKIFTALLSFIYIFSSITHWSVATCSYKDISGPYTNINIAPYWESSFQFYGQKEWSYFIQREWFKTEISELPISFVYSDWYRKYSKEENLYYIYSWNSVFKTERMWSHVPYKRYFILSDANKDRLLVEEKIVSEYSKIKKLKTSINGNHYGIIWIDSDWTNIVEKNWVVIWEYKKVEKIAIGSKWKKVAFLVNDWEWKIHLFENTKIIKSFKAITDIAFIWYTANSNELIYMLSDSENKYELWNEHRKIETLNFDWINFSYSVFFETDKYILHTSKWDKVRIWEINKTYDKIHLVNNSIDFDKYTIMWEKDWLTSSVNHSWEQKQLPYTYKFWAISNNGERVSVISENEWNLYLNTDGRITPLRHVQEVFSMKYVNKTDLVIEAKVQNKWIVIKNGSQLPWDMHKNPIGSKDWKRLIFIEIRWWMQYVVEELCSNNSRTKKDEHKAKLLELKFWEKIIPKFEKLLPTLTKDKLLRAKGKLENINIENIDKIQMKYFIYYIQESINLEIEKRL